MIVSGAFDVFVKVNVAMTPSPSEKVDLTVSMWKMAGWVSVVAEACPSQKLDSAIMMMQPSDLRDAIDGAKFLNRTTFGSILAKRKMRTGMVVIVKITSHDPA